MQVAKNAELCNMTEAYEITQEEMRILLEAKEGVIDAARTCDADCDSSKSASMQATSVIVDKYKRESDELMKTTNARYAASEAQGPVHGHAYTRGRGLCRSRPDVHPAADRGAQGAYPFRRGCIFCCFFGGRLASSPCDCAVFAYHSKPCSWRRIFYLFWTVGYNWWILRCERRSLVREWWIPRWCSVFHRWIKHASDRVNQEGWIECASSSLWSVLDESPGGGSGSLHSVRHVVELVFSHSGFSHFVFSFRSLDCDRWHSFAFSHQIREDPFSVDQEGRIRPGCSVIGSGRDGSFEIGRVSACRRE